MKLVPFDLGALSAIKARYAILDDDYRKILIISYEGIYRPGSAGHSDAAYMHAAAAAGVAATDAYEVIFDFSALDYIWGDDLERVYNAAASLSGDDQRFAVVVGEGCREAIRTLELGQFSTEPLSAIPWAHESIEAACTYLIALDLDG